MALRELQVLLRAVQAGPQLLSATTLQERGEPLQGVVWGSPTLLQMRLTELRVLSEVVAWGCQTPLGLVLGELQVLLKEAGVFLTVLRMVLQELSVVEESQILWETFLAELEIHQGVAVVEVVVAAEEFPTISALVMRGLCVFSRMVQRVSVLGVTLGEL